MTCIAAVVEGSRIVMGGDSAAIGWTELTVRADQKVFQNGDMLMGFCGSFRMGQLLRHAFTPPRHPRDQDVQHYMVTTFMDGVRKALKDGGFMRKKDEEESLPDSSFVVGYRGRLFEVGEDYQVGEAVDGFLAIGCGAQIAQGALYVLQHGDPKRRVRAALEAAERYSAGVRRPFHILELAQKTRKLRKGRAA